MFSGWVLLFYIDRFDGFGCCFGGGGRVGGEGDVILSEFLFSFFWRLEVLRRKESSVCVCVFFCVRLGTFR